MTKDPLGQNGHLSQKDCNNNEKLSCGDKTLRQSDSALHGASVWSALKTQLPNLSGLNVLDLGCGFGDFARLARDMGAKAVTGVDASAKMLAAAQAREMTLETRIIYRQSSVEDFNLGAGEYDLVVSLMALHHLELNSFSEVIKRVYQGIKPGGRLVITVEHPICAVLHVDQLSNEPGPRNHWVKDHYSDESDRLTCWFIDGVIKYHPTVATYVNTLLDCGFRLLNLSEPTSAKSALAQDANLRSNCHRLPILLLAAEKNV